VGKVPLTIPSPVPPTCALEDAPLTAILTSGRMDGGIVGVENCWQMGRPVTLELAGWLLGGC
jgi:hypothetical protein